MKDLYFVPECYVDTNLIESLLETDGVNHQMGCNNVAKAMESGVLKESFAVGIIDSDKRKLAYAEYFEEIAHSQHLFLLKHKEKPKFMIKISPAIDRFILDCAQEQGVNVNEFGLSSELKEFTKQTKNVESKKDLRFKKLFKKLKDNQEIIILRNVLNFLKENKYNSTQEDLIRFF